MGAGWGLLLARAPAIEVSPANSRGIQRRWNRAAAASASTAAASGRLLKWASVSPNHNSTKAPRIRCHD
jgi:hypothetical protein